MSTLLFAGALAGLLASIPGCRLTDWQIWNRCDKATADYEVQHIRSVAYCEGPRFQAHRHQLDLFLPIGKADFPVVVLVHGGAWVAGDNRWCGLYSSVGEFLASQGIGAVLPNYRLSPKVKHPEHVKDIARAFAWTKKHIREYGGDPEKMFLVGHSAGGHLVALLSADEQYLKAEGCRSSDIRGVVAVSGVYRIPEGKTQLELGGSSPRSVRLDEVSPLRGPLAPRSSGTDDGEVHGWPVSVNVFGPAFGNDPKARAAASPVNHVRPDLPPFLILSARNDLPLLPEMAQEFHRALQSQGIAAQHVTVEHRNHNSLLFKAITRDDPVAKMIVQFIRAN